MSSTAGNRPSGRPLLTRRESLALGIAGIGLGGLVLPSALGLRPALAQEHTDAYGPEVHGLSVFGDLALPPDFSHLAYIDPKAPIGGEIRLQIDSSQGNQNFLTFNTLNVFNFAGDGAAGVPASFDSLMGGNSDEPDALYGLVARAIRVSPDKRNYRFLLREEARFHDGTPLTAKDVAFSLNVLRSKGHPSFRLPLRDLDAAVASAPDVLDVSLKAGHARDAILFIGGLPIFSAAYYAKVPFDEVSLDPPLGSGSYKLGSFQQGRYVEMDRVADYWGKDLPINVGTGNFGKLRYEYYADRKIAFEGFKAGDFTFREEFTASVWATQYNFPAIEDGRVQKESLKDDFPNGTQGWFFNTRRDKFKNPRVREAIGEAFDFKWTDANIMYGAYTRTISYFQNSPMAATGTPSAEELKLLKPFKAKLSPDVFGEVYVPPDGDGSGTDRAMLRKGYELLKAAGCRRDGERLLLADGSPLTIEFLDFDPALTPHTLPFIHNLKLIGIDASYRVVDPAQYKRRTDAFDFDVVVQRSGFGLTPGAALRDFFGSEAAKTSGSRNLCGISDPVVDALIEQAVSADTREKLTIACKCIDRVLRASHYWVPMWNKSRHDIAYWNLFGRPSQTAKYGLNAVSTWWYDETKAQKTALRPR